MLSRWSRPNGYRDVIAVGLPLVISLASTTVMQFTDRMFLSNYSMEAISAALPAGIANFTFMSFFLGVAGYLNVFIAQYCGSGAPQRAGAALWQGLWFALVSGFLLCCLWFVAEPLFRFAGHPAGVQQLEVTYFRILNLGAGFAVAAAALAAFFSGRGLTRPVMIVNMTGAALNIPLDFCLINGFGPLPELGIAGAALATVTSQFVIVLMYIRMIFTDANERSFAVKSAWRPDRIIITRLVRYGLPGGIQFFLDIFAITFFVFMIGRMGSVELAASNIALSIDSLAFLPMIGFNIATSTLVGQAIGSGRPHLAEEATISALHICLGYMTVIAAVFVFAPELLLKLFQPNSMSAEEFAPIVDIGVTLLRFVALFSLFDGVAIIFFGALKGAGDTFFVMCLIGSLSIFGMAVPVFILSEYFHAGLYTLWIVITAYVLLLAIGAWARYRSGRWKGMRVVETAPALS